MPRHNNRAPDQLRPISFTRRYTRHAEGAVLACCGETRVLCTASVETRVPAFLRGRQSGWLTAEYRMLPRATHTRSEPRPNGRAYEIQRLIGRALRACLDLRRLGEHTIIIDCDVLQADGGTRCAALNGGYLALVDAVDWLLAHELIRETPLKRALAAVSVAVCDGEVLIDPDYDEDCRADTDLTLVMDEAGGFLELQANAERRPIPRELLDRMLDCGAAGIESVFEAQRRAETDDR